MKKFLMCCLLLVEGALFAEAPAGWTVSRVSAQQRWPWDQKVDLSFFLEIPEADTTATAGARMAFTATVNGETRALTGVSDAIARGAGYHTVTWDAAADFPALVDLKNVSFGVTIAEAPLKLVYMIVDLETGAIRYEAESFAQVVNTVADYKTRDMVFRYIPSTTSAEWAALSGGKDTFTIGTDADESAFGQNSSDTAREGAAEKRLTKSFWMAVYPCSVAQLSRLNGSTTPSDDTAAAIRLTYTDVRGADGVGSAYCFPTSTAVNPNSPLGRLRARTGRAFDLPTEAQWEYALRAGTTGPYICEAAELENYVSRTRALGTKTPNAWGLYDMLLCVHQWTTTLGRVGDANSANCLHTETATDDPTGAAPTTDSPFRVTRGSHSGAQDAGKRVARSAYRYPQCSASPGEWDYCGARFCLTNAHD